MSPRRTRETRRYGDREVEVTNADKVLFPEDGLTKRDVLAYVELVADALLAGLRDRPLSMERYVEGLRGEGFFHKHKPAHFPDWVRTTTVPTSKGPMEQVVVDDLATLVLVTNFGCLTPHIPCTTVSRPFHPDALVVDLDPSVEDVEVMRRAGRAVRELLEERGWRSFPRWSGSRGLHVVVPLDGQADAAVVGAVADALAARLVERHPDLFTLAFKKADREGKIYVDVGRNQPGATVVASWALRARPGAPVAMPVTWDEVEATSPRHFTIRTAPERLGLEPWAGFDAARVTAR